jgi:hypothetical protein
VKIDQVYDDERESAHAHCLASGLTLLQVRHLIWCGAVSTAASLALPNVGTRQFWAVLDRDGTVITIRPPMVRMGGKLKILSEREASSALARHRRRARKKPSRPIKQQKEYEYD